MNKKAGGDKFAEPRFGEKYVTVYNFMEKRERDKCAADVSPEIRSHQRLIKWSKESMLCVGRMFLKVGEVVSSFNGHIAVLSLCVHMREYIGTLSCRVSLHYSY